MSFTPFSYIFTPTSDPTLTPYIKDFESFKAAAIHAYRMMDFYDNERWRFFAAQQYVEEVMSLMDPTWPWYPYCALFQNSISENSQALANCTSAEQHTWLSWVLSVQQGVDTNEAVMRAWQARYKDIHAQLEGLFKVICPEGEE